MMEKSKLNSWQVRVAALVIFLLGFVAGGLALNAYRSWVRPARNAGGAYPVELMVDRLQLKEEQKTQVRQIFSETREQLQALRRESEPRVREIRQQADERLQKVLSPEQWEQFQQMRSEMRGSRRRGRGPRGDASPGATP